MTVMTDGKSAVGEYSTILKMESAHKRPIVRLFFLATYNNYNLVTVAHDSVKIWDVIDDDTTSFQECIELSKWRCGVQSADMRSSLQEIVVVGLDSVLYRITPEVQGNIETMRVDPFDFGYMEAWNCCLDDSARTCITTGYSGNITEIDVAGISCAEITRREPFANIKQVCYMSYSNNSRMIALASIDGTVHIVDHDALKLKYTMEVHAMKIRAMTFTTDDEYILTGSDDKSVRLSQIGANRMLIRQFCGHRSAITSIAIDPTSANARFASSSTDGEIFIWDINTPTPIHGLKNPHEGTINSVVFSYSGHHLFSAGEDMRLVCYQVPQIGEPIITIAEQMEDYEDDKENLFGDRTPVYRSPGSVSPSQEESSQEAAAMEEDLDDV